MTPEPDLSRRNMILAGGSAAAAVALAACSSTPATSSPGAGAGPAGPAPTDPSGSASGSGASAPATEVAKLADIPVGGGIAATLNGQPILLAQPTAGTVVGFSAKCPHQGCKVAPAAKEFDCPCHQSRFDLATGKVLGGPAPRALDKVTVTVDGGAVMAG